MMRTLLEAMEKNQKKIENYTILKGNMKTAKIKRMYGGFYDLINLSS